MIPGGLLAAAALLVLCGVGWGWRAAWRRLRVPPAVSLMVLGSVAGPSGLDLAPETYLDAAPLLSKVAFTLLLLRAGLAMDPATLRAVVRTGVVLGTVPVAVELGVVAGVSRLMLFSRWDLALLTGFLIAAVSPAVVLPTMLGVKERGLGRARHVPDRAMAQTIVNAFVAQTGIVLVLRAISPEPGGPGPFPGLALLPLAVLGGLALGGVLGRLVPLGAEPKDPRRARRRSIVMGGLAVITYFGGAALHVENVFATVALGVVLRRRLQSGEEDRSREHRRHLSRAWSVAEIVLFANLGAAVDLEALHGALLLVGLGVIAMGLACRVIIVALLLKRSRLRGGEPTYLAIAHLPKATIQAVFGALPLATFARHGQTHLEGDGQAILILSVLAIVATAPVGAVLLERTALRLLGEGRPPPGREA